jgi:hypothetical protein
MGAVRQTLTEYAIAHVRLHRDMPAYQARRRGEWPAR